jgi:hypothetical protein
MIMDENQSPVSWGAILAGAFSAGALTLILATLATGTGFSLISPTQGSSVSPTTFKVTAGVYLVLTAIIASAVGGYMAGRLRAKWTIDGDETLFRDTAHGLAAWAVATVALAAILGTGSLAVLGGAARGLSQGAGQTAVQSSNSPSAYYADVLLRPAAGAAGVGGAQSDAQPVRQEVGRIFARDLTSSDGISDADRRYLAQLVATRTGTNQDDANRRVSEVIEQAKSAAETTRKYAVALALWATLAMFAGAFAASAAAIEGGQLRDGRWRGVIFAAKPARPRR